MHRFCGESSFCVSNRSELLLALGRWITDLAQFLGNHEPGNKSSIEYMEKLISKGIGLIESQCDVITDLDTPIVAC